jgi:uncharacterized damage-inducible protein DinB
MDKADARTLIDYMAWARERMLSALEPLSEEELNRELGGSFGSLQRTLVHIYGAEYVFDMRLRGERVTGMPDPQGFSTLADLRAAWRQLRLDAWVESLPDGPIEAVLTYTDTHGNPRTTPLSMIVQHLANHQTYHRGQVTHMLRQLGRRAPSTDFSLYYREKQNAQ